jgi:HEAT repeat protein
MMTLPENLQAIFDADRTLRAVEAALLENPKSDALIGLLEAAAEEALHSADRTEATMRLERLADLCAQVPGPRMTDTLIHILNDEDPRVRIAAGEALRDIGYERYAEVARGIERALDREMSGPAMSELPWVLAEIGEPSALPLIRRFLNHGDADVVAAAIEALVQLADPEAAPDLERFLGDPRKVIVDDFEEESQTTLGDLAEDALTILAGEAAEGD